MPSLATISRTVCCVAIAAVLSLQQGCLPIPSTTKVSAALHGVVLDGSTNHAIAGARIQINRSSYHAETVTNSKGEYSLAPLLQWHYLVYIGDPGVFPTPIYLRDDGAAPLSISVWAPGYKSSYLLFDSPRVYSEPPGPKNNEPVDIKLEPRAAKPAAPP